ncbi:TPA: class A beta-lactamase Bla1 [Bacillus pacificus]|uniref:class A beta-lactamase Bla1 n=1 Tax=Bacillus cereus group sp. Bc010 TaxID=3018125 RepID=UPI0009B3386A|nr:MULTISPECIES: class A beta-lactamase Bla1 [Bacillus cereus group]MCC2387172.1 class A beta-lactamase Bla1 [Bacillus pacificus]MDA2767216.1 class A beta-lactamase Bla1 [Bacillus cereus group sp. Bc010]MED1449029.1 class A beta-lactamase Bla1 [Bacillus pacificus]HDR7256129.1 class A beta-lactamase Bla1 [Bacillus pacificus]HDR7256368.1 class A beta-lactamase Bla1 [Bacillus pacificus]
MKGMMILKNKRMLKIGICVGILGISLTSLEVFKGETLQVEAKEKTGKVKHKNQATHKEFSQLEKKFDAQLGVYAIDTGTNETIAYRPNERFAFASTYKALAAGVLLQQNSIDTLNEVIKFTKEDLVDYSPITEKHIDPGMTLGEIAEAAVRYSDNTAGNILFHKIGGPKGYEKALRQMGDRVTMSDRFETELNEAIPGDIRDTSTAKAIATNLKDFTVGNALPDDKRKVLTDWMKGNATGDKLIRAGVPTDWEVGDKSGAGSYGTRNDIAIVWPPNRAPIIIAILSSKDEKEATYDNQLIKEAAEVVIDAIK